MVTLRDAMPIEFMDGDDCSINFYDVEVVAEYRLSDDDTWISWPGTHKNVMFWVKLANGKAVGWNENPGRGWSFPMVTLK